MHEVAGARLLPVKSAGQMGSDWRPAGRGQSGPGRCTAADQIEVELARVRSALDPPFPEPTP
jgi:hypothetical protein